MTVRRRRSNSSDEAGQESSELEEDMRMAASSDGNNDPVALQRPNIVRQNQREEWTCSGSVTIAPHHHHATSLSLPPAASASAAVAVAAAAAALQRGPALTQQRPPPSPSHPQPTAGTQITEVAGSGSVSGSGSSSNAVAAGSAGGNIGNLLNLLNEMAEDNCSTLEQIDDLIVQAHSSSYPCANEETSGLRSGPPNKNIADAIKQEEVFSPGTSPAPSTSFHRGSAVPSGPISPAGPSTAENSFYTVSQQQHNAKLVKQPHVPQALQHYPSEQHTNLNPHQHLLNGNDRLRMQQTSMNYMESDGTMDEDVISSGQHPALDELDHNQISGSPSHHSSSGRDDKYWERRRKNNMAAKKSRDARRVRENQLRLKVLCLENANGVLRSQVKREQEATSRLRERVKELEDERRSNGGGGGGNGHV